MFSEYASRFLAQSQSRLVVHYDDARRKGHERLIQPPGNPRSLSSRSFLQRAAVDPYQTAASQFSNLALGSRNPVHQAPLFYSATDEFREEDDETEHEREIADFYALQKSRRHFGINHLMDSSENDEDGRFLSSLEESVPQQLTRTLSKGKGIWSSWREGSLDDNAPNPQIFNNGLSAEPREELQTNRMSFQRGENLVDVRLEDTVISDAHSEEATPPELGDDTPPSIQRFREKSGPRMNRLGIGSSTLPPGPDNAEAQALFQGESSPASYQESIVSVRVGSPVYDAFWGQLFLISIACLFATSFLIYLHTSPPSDLPKLGDAVYSTIHNSFFRLAIFTLVSISVSLLWLALLRSYVRVLVYVIIFVVPAILYSFSLYPFISSFRGAWHGSSIQDKVMRWGSAIPFVIASAWIYNIIRSRRAIGRAVGILEFACRILAANIELLVLGLGVLLLTVVWTWGWMLMFTRVFLKGHTSVSVLVFMDPSSWWLGAYYVLIYLWSLGVISGIQRTITAATVSQWYFHRFSTPAPTSRQIIQAAAYHCLTTSFGTACLSSLLVLLIRLPLLLLPNRISSVFSLCAYSLVPTPLAVITNPLALTYAAIHSQPLTVSARGLMQMTNLAPSAAMTPLHPRSFTWSREHYAPLVSYRLSKLILHAARLMMSLALGFGGWVSTARNFRVPSENGATHGSLYAYMIGLIAGAIGWSILGAVESVIADIVDASVICWSSEVGTYGREARYCREAGWLFGQEPIPSVSYTVSSEP
ncbi:uncharacterized protein BO95DRAFT_444305 [Aspergillus brunneoviolaceus CBS 621.78]|uniref:Ctl transporter n=1 Tax=Aspergillus brunneoviolaceus CBS 621.78 TaxID=1450534 RepID=A0ACD1G4X3_9EURO|nr:ctl transporter [Aspergillus brunneoviolaceus CBS 621.78]RAH44208.1 ctl transporter [Aspergillus brunneoviolaceus CBS 621.78]